MSDRAISAERQVRILEDAKRKEDTGRIMTTPPTMQQQVASEPVRRAASELPNKELIRLLSGNIEDGPLCPSIQSFCASLLRKVADTSSGKGSLSRKGRGDLHFTLGKERTKTKTPVHDASPTTTARRIYRRAKAIDDLIRDMPNGEKHSRTCPR